MKQDLQNAFRAIRKYPVSSAVIVLTIAMMVTVVGVYYGSIQAGRAAMAPLKNGERMVRLWRMGKTTNMENFPSVMLEDYQAKARSFEMVGALQPYQPRKLTGVGEPVSLTSVSCTAEILAMTGLNPLAGRFFTKEDEKEENRGQVILSERIWRERFAADKDILGETITLDDEPFVVVGVVSRVLERSGLAWNTDLWLPRNWTNEEASRRVELIGLLREGVSHEQANAELAVLAPQLEEAFHPTEYELRFFGDDSYGAKVSPLNKRLHHTYQAQELFAIAFVAVLFISVILIACFNMTSLFLVRATSRTREMAVRISLGAARLRIVRLMLVESVTLAILGGVVGLFLSFWILQANSAQRIELAFDPGLYLFAFGCAVLLGGLVSVLPAWRAGNADLHLALKDGVQSSAGRKRHRFRNFLVASQVGMAALLTVAAALFARGAVNLYADELGFNPGRVATVSMDLDRKNYVEGRKISDFAQRAREAVAELPGVELAGVGSIGLVDSFAIGDRIQISGTTDTTAGDMFCSYLFVSPEVPEIFGQRLVRGAGFSQGGNVLNEAIVNETFVEKYLPDADPLGREVSSGMTQGPLTIVGVVTDRHVRLSQRSANPEIYASILHPVNNGSTISVLARTQGGDATALGPLLREALKPIDPDQPIGTSTTIAQFIEEKTRPFLMVVLALVGMAGFGLLMALMGVYGVVGYAVLERTREMGIRMAVGADRRRVVLLVMREGTRLLLKGGIPGLLIGSSLTAMLPPQILPSIDPRDPSIYMAGFLVVAFAGLAAALVPALKMIKLNPMEALRHE